MCHMSGVPCQESHVKFQLSRVTCQVLRVACHLSLTPTATATDPSHANSPFMYSRLICKDQKTFFSLKKNAKKIIKTAKTQNG